MGALKLRMCSLYVLHILRIDDFIKCYFLEYTLLCLDNYQCEVACVEGSNRLEPVNTACKTTPAFDHY